VNQILLKNKDKGQSDEEFIRAWENSSFTLEPLFKAIKELSPKDRVTKDDLNSPSLIEKLIWLQAQREFAEKILELFPKALTNK